MIPMLYLTFSHTRLTFRQTVLTGTLFLSIVFVGRLFFIRFGDFDFIYAQYPYSGGLPYRDVLLEYPILWGTIYYLLLGPARISMLHFYLTFSVLLWVFWLLTTWFLYRMHNSHSFEVPYFFAVSPSVLFLTFHNFDMLCALLSLFGLSLLSQGKNYRGSALLSTASMLKLYPIVLLIPVVRWPVKRIICCLFVVAGLITIFNSPLIVYAPTGFSYIYTFHADRPGLYSLYEYLPWSPSMVNIVSLVSFVVAILIITLKGRKLRLAPLSTLCLMAFFLTNKVYSPSYNIILDSLLAYIGHAPSIGFLIMEIGNLIVMTRYGPYQTGVIGVILRIGGLLIIAHQIFHNRHMRIEVTPTTQT